MERSVASLIVHLEFGLHRQKVSDCKLRLLVACPVKRRAAFVVYLVNVETLVHRKVIKADRLIALSSDMQTISAVDIRDVHVRTHFVDHQLDELEVAMVRCEMECGELFISVRVNPRGNACFTRSAAV